MDLFNELNDSISREKQTLQSIGGGFFPFDTKEPVRRYCYSCGIIMPDTYSINSCWYCQEEQRMTFRDLSYVDNLFNPVEKF